jgi:hypothetical protein
VGRSGASDTATLKGEDVAAPTIQLIKVGPYWVNFANVFAIWEVPGQDTLVIAPVGAQDMTNVSRACLHVRGEARTALLAKLEGTAACPPPEVGDGD